MDRSDVRYEQYVSILKEELLPAMGCTESIAIAYAAAKASCAAKIASAVDAGLIGMYMYERGNQFFAGDGIVKHGVEKTIETVGRLARQGMKATDEEIIRLMLEE